MTLSHRKSVRMLVLLLTGALTLSLAPAITTAASSAEECKLCSVKPTVKKWLEYLEEGNARKAWRLMTKQSRRTIGGFEAFKKERSAWAEGWGAWANARRRDFEVRVIAPMDDDAASVVTMTGIVAQEGPSRRSAAALPVITHDGVTKVDPVHGRAEIRAVRPGGRETLTHRPRFKAIVKRIRARNNSVFFVVKNSRVDPQQAKLNRIGRRSYRATLRWPRRLSAGPHVLTIASWGRNGFKAVAVRFKVQT
ncbi:MAG: hypothetical protein GEU71_18475, partial [Actinobacteria bacterium]|nr:hypothetical protein [Actinomycetota bacterium]